MSFSDVCCSVANQMGEFAGKSRTVFSSAKKKLKESTKVLQPNYLSEKIRNAMFEKLSRALCKQAEFVMTKLSERMEVIDEVARPFYEKVNALSAHGPVSETQLWQALNSIEAAKDLTEEEKVLLVNLFGQIVGAQKAKFVDAVVVEKQTKSSVANKRAVLTAKSKAN